MRIKGPTVRKGDGGIQCSPSTVTWHRNPIKNWLYLHGINRLNVFLFNHFKKEIEL